MGSFAGHVIAGSFSLLYGTWWCLLSVWLDLKLRKHKGKMTAVSRSNGTTPSSKCGYFKRNFKSCFKPSGYCLNDVSLRRKSWIPTPCICNFPLEPIVKVFACSLGILEETFLDYNEKCEVITIVYSIRKENGELNNLEKLYHISMYSCFLASGIVDLLSLRVKFPWQTSMLFLSLAFVAESVMFYFHIQGRDSFNIINHLMLVYTAVSCTGFSMLRLYSPSNFVFNLGLGSSMLLQGTWFIQMGYYLYGSFLHKEEHISHGHVMLVTACFMWHMLLIALTVLVLWMACSYFSNFDRCNAFKNRGTSYIIMSPAGWKGSVEEGRGLIVTEKNTSDEVKTEEECP